MGKKRPTIKKKTWDEFRAVGLLWFVNRILHIFGWAIIFTVNIKDNVTDIYPARVSFRGFREEDEEKGFINLSDYLKKNIDKLQEEAHE